MRRKTLFLLLLGVLAVAGLVQAFPDSAGSGIHSFGDPYPRIVHQVFYHVQKKYVEPDRADPRKLLEGALEALETQYPQVIADMSVGPDSVEMHVDEAERTFDLKSADRMNQAADVLNKILTFVSEHIGDDVEEKDLYYVALNGALGVLDPHSNVFSPKHFKEFMIGTRGSFGGIGFVFGIRDGDMTIITPIEGTPADRAGLRSGDKILYIDGEPTINMPVDMAAGKMRGEPGTQVTLTLSREGWAEPKAITFTREVIHVDSVESYVLGGDGEAPVIFAKVKNFQKDTTDELRKAVREAEAAHPESVGIVLDLRNNPGGLLEQAIALSDGFLDDGTIVSTRGPEGDANSVSEARDDEPISEKPLVVLVNQGSASASEIVSGALKASRALVIGQKTFGKGSVQKLYPLTDGGALKLTVAQYLTPGDVSIQSIGIEPDIAVYPANIEKGSVRLGPPPSHVDEAMLDNAFSDWGNASDKPWAEIQYLAPKPDEDELSFAELGTEEKLSRLRDEFEVRLARRILGQVPEAEATSPKERLAEAAKPVLKAMRLEEENKIAEALSELGVDWSRGADGGAALRVVFSPDVVLKAGETTTLTLTAENVGTGPAYRVWGRTDSENLLLKNVDFVFGRVDPGQKVSWSADLEVPLSAQARWDLVTLQLHTAGIEEAGSGSGGVSTLPVPRPDFAYTYELAEENAEDPARSGDGILEEGDRARLVLDVQNRGDGAGKEVEVNIRGDEKEELHLETARYRLEDLAPGKSTGAPMSFRVVKAGEEGLIKVGVSITDRDYGVFFGDNLTFEAGKKYEARQARIPPNFLVPESPPLRTSADRIVLELQVNDDESVKDFYAFVGKRKIRYERNEAGGKTLPIRLEIPLEEGSNRLVLAARDQLEILHTRTFFIFRTSADTPDVELGMK